jgi:hypothetical protein
MTIGDLFTLPLLLLLSDNLIYCLKSTLEALNKQNRLLDDGQNANERMKKKTQQVSFEGI